METYAKILMIASPIFLVLVLAEKLYGYLKYKDEFHSMDMISSLSSGFTNTIKDVLGLSVTLISYKYLVDHFAFFHIENSFWLYPIAFIALDFSGYWTHRWAHQINFFWNKHAIHHSSEEFNLACALRQSISQFVNIFTFLLIPAALLGVPAQVIAVVAPIQFFAQFWYHTVYINRMGFLEKILVTPSHHRVHHAINPIYMDKNHSQVFIIWDKLFGTFQEELADEKPVFGITRPVETWNPIKINFKHLWLMIQDAWRSDVWSDKFTIWFKPTGWRPAGFDEKYPVKKIQNHFHFDKYKTEFSLPARFWVWTQFFATIVMLMLWFNSIGQLSIFGMFAFGFLLFLTVYCYTDFMDQNPTSVFMEILKDGIGFYFFAFTDVFNPIYLGNPILKYAFIAYYIIAAILTFVLSQTFEKNKFKMA